MEAKRSLPPLNIGGTRIAVTQSRLEFPTPQVVRSRKAFFFNNIDNVSEVSISPLRRKRRPSTRAPIPRTLDTCSYCGEKNPRHWGANPCRHTDICLKCLQSLHCCPTCGKQIQSRFRNYRGR